MCASARLGTRGVHVEIYKIGSIGIESGLDVWSGRERVVLEYGATRSRVTATTTEWDQGVTSGLYREFFRCT